MLGVEILSNINDSTVTPPRTHSLTHHPLLSQSQFTFHMDYERAQAIKRKIIAGRVAAAEPFPIIYNPVIVATKRYHAHKVIREERGGLPGMMKDTIY